MNKRNILTRVKAENCFGCGNCATRCPAGVLEMRRQGDGFLYPSALDLQHCAECGICLNSCPCCSPPAGQSPIRAYAANMRSGLKESGCSSGGAAALLGEEMLKRGGIVYGAVYTPTFEVVHRAAGTLSELREQRGSKYIQSDLNVCFREMGMPDIDLLRFDLPWSFKSETISCVSDFHREILQIPTECIEHAGQIFIADFLHEN